MSLLPQLRKTFPVNKRLYTAVQVPATGNDEGFSPVYRNASSPGKLVANLGDDLATLHDLFENAVKLFGDDDCLGERQKHRDGSLDGFYTYQSYYTINERRFDVASGLIRSVMDHPKFKHSEANVDGLGKPKFVVSISGSNSIEMIVLDLATRSFSLSNTGLYESLSEDAAVHILRLTESPVMVINKSLLPKFVRLKQRLPALFLMIVFEDITSNDQAMISSAKEQGVDVLSFSEVEKYGHQNRLPADYNLPRPSTLYTLAFTSGTTGMPKGVYLTHANATANVTGFIVHCPKPAVGLTEQQLADFRYNKDSKGDQLRTICFLPLLHNYEKSITNFELSYGIALALPSKPGTLSLFDDLPLIEPSLFTAVPRVFTVFENKMKSFISSLPSTANITTEVRKKFGLSNISYLQCASAPISNESIYFFKDTLKCGFLNSYGSTECFSVISWSDPYDIRAGSSGPVGVTSELRLRDIPEMGYTSKDKPYARGEILVRGTCSFSHYYKNEKATAEAIDSLGWYHSGDVAALDNEGNLFIIDRVKNFFKLAQGEYVTPEKIETVYLSKNPVLTQLFVHGDSYSNYLVGIAGVDLDAVRLKLKPLIDCTNWSGEDVFSLLKVSKVKQFLLKDLNKNIKNTGLQGFEKLHNLHFELQPLSVENESLTPSYKLKRSAAKKVHETKLRNLYEEGSLILASLL